MAPGEMAEARSGTPKKYSCACGLSQNDRKRQFSGKCRHCNTRPKFLRAQSSFDSGSASRGTHVRFSPLSTPTNAPERGPITTTTHVAEVGGTPPSRSANTTSSSPRADNTTLHSPNLFQPPSPSVSSIARFPMARALDASSANSSSPLNCGNSSMANINDTPVLQPSETRRRSRSVDRYDVEQLHENPPPYNSVTEGRRGRLSTRGQMSSRVRRTESEDTTVMRNRRSTPPPSYEAAQNPNPPSYEEALAFEVSGLSISQGLSALIATTPDLRTSLPSATGFLGRPTSLLASLDLEQERERASRREAQRETERQSRHLVQRQAERELQIERERESEREMERERMRELQVAQYCGCSKCQSLYYNYYYNDSLNEGSAFPMETQVIMQEVLADGLAFCSLM